METCCFCVSDTQSDIDSLYLIRQERSQCEMTLPSCRLHQQRHAASESPVVSSKDVC